MKQCALDLVMNQLLVIIASTISVKEQDKNQMKDYVGGVEVEMANICNFYFDKKERDKTVNNRDISREYYCVLYFIFKVGEVQ